MKFGILFTSHPDPDAEPYPHRDLHARVTAQIIEADRLGYDIAWIAEHHFSNKYGIMPDPFIYVGHLAALTKRIGLGMAVMTLPLHNPIRIAENAALTDILSNGRVLLGIGSGYRPYEYDGFGLDFEARYDIQEEAIPVLLDALHKRQVDHSGPNFQHRIGGEYEIFPVSVQQPHPPLYMAAGTERSISVAGRNGFGLMLSTLPGFDTLAGQIDFYRKEMHHAPAPLDGNPAFGNVDIARWIYVAETDAEAKAESEEGIIRHLTNFLSKGTAGYLGRVSEKDMGISLDYDSLLKTTIIHGSPETVISRLKELKAKTGLGSLVLHYPPYYGNERAVKMLRMFAEKVMPAMRDV